MLEEVRRYTDCASASAIFKNKTGMYYTIIHTAWGNPFLDIK